MPQRVWLSQLTPEGWMTLVAEQGLESVHLTGGEPLLYPGLIDLIQGLYNNSKRVSVLSNGSRPQLIAENADDFSRLCEVHISLDSVEAKVHDRHRGQKGAHAAAVKSINNLSKLSVPVCVSMVVDETTVHGIRAMAGFCRQNDIKLILRPLAQIGASHDSFRLESTHLDDVRDVLTPDQFGYGAPSVDGFVPQPTFNPAGVAYAS